MTELESAFEDYLQKLLNVYLLDTPVRMTIQDTRVREVGGAQAMLRVGFVVRWGKETRSAEVKMCVGGGVVNEESFWDSVKDASYGAIEQAIASHKRGRT